MTFLKINKLVNLVWFNFLNFVIIQKSSVLKFFFLMKTLSYVKYSFMELNYFRVGFLFKLELNSIWLIRASRFNIVDLTHKFKNILLNFFQNNTTYIIKKKNSHTCVTSPSPYRLYRCGKIKKKKLYTITLIWLIWVCLTLINIFFCFIRIYITILVHTSDAYLYLR